MGITIHYQGRARSRDAVDSVRELAERFAARAGWPVSLVDVADGTLERVVNEQEQDYHGRVCGCVLLPHPDADHLAFLFGDDLFLQDYCKTQFAGTEVHLQVISLLREIAPYFEELEVIDEGEYWDGHDERRLNELFAGFDAALVAFLRENPRAQVKVRIPSGRVVDVIE